MKVVFSVMILTLPFLAWGAPAWEWRWGNPQPTGNNLIKVIFSDSVRGITVSDNGETAETRDGGETWTTRPGRIGSNTLVAAMTRDGNTLMAVAADGRIWKSTDGGRAWRDLFRINGSLYDVCQSGPDIMLAVGGEGTITRSLDKGETWKVARVDSLGPDLLGIHCWDQGSAIAVGEEGTILKSLDSGKTWNKQPSPTLDMLTGVTFADMARGYATAAGGRILDTRDGGLTWTSQALDTLAFFRGIQLDGSSLTVVGSDGSIWISRDSGGKWARSESGTPQYLASSAKVGTKGEVIVGNTGLILKSADGGATWKARNVGSTKDLWGLAAISSTSWVAFGSESVVLKTQDGGLTWKEGFGPKPAKLSAGNFLGRKGLLTGYGGTIFVSGDAGETWQEAESPVKTRWLDGVAWCDSSTAIAVGDSGTLLRSTDSGHSWKIQTGIPGLSLQTLSGVRFLPDGTGLIVGYRGLILKTVDKGLSWKQIPTPLNNDLFGFAFFNASVGMAVGSKGAALITQDGGETWSARPTGHPDDYLYGLAWLGPDTAVVVGQSVHYTVLRLTTDGGKTWSELPIPTATPLYTIAGLDSGRIAVMGQNGSVLLGRLAGGSSGIRTDGSRVWNGSKLLVQRMGSLPLVKISFFLSRRERIRISGHSPDGRLIRQVFSGNLPPGSQSLLVPYPTGRVPVLFRMETGEDGRAGVRSFMLPY